MWRRRAQKYTSLTAPVAASIPYIDVVNGLSPVAHWPLNDLVGVSAHCEVNAAQSGTYDGPALNSADCPFGQNRVPYFDGVNDIVDIYSATLGTNISHTDISVSLWMKFRIDLWTSATARVFFQIRMQIPNENNNIIWTIYSNGFVANEWLHKGNGSVTLVRVADSPAQNWGTNWNHFVHTTSIANNRFRAYDNGELTVAEVAGTTAWVAGDISTTRSNLGANHIVTKAGQHDGNLAYIALFNRELSPAEVLTLYNGGPV